MEPHSEINALAKKVRLNDFADIQMGGKNLAKILSKQFTHHSSLFLTLSLTCTHSHALVHTHMHSHFYLPATNKNFLGVF